MQNRREPSLRRDCFKFTCFVLALVGIGMLFFGTSDLALSTLYSLVLVSLLSPSVAALERKGLSRSISIFIVFTAMGAAIAFCAFFATKSWQAEFESVQENAPWYFERALSRLSAYETSLKARLPFMASVDLTTSLSNWGTSTGKWFILALPGLMSSVLSCMLLVPILTFCLLSEGRQIQKSLFQLVPNRFFESVYIVSRGVSTALADYLRAKLIQAFLVGAIVMIGLAWIQFPYAIVLGVWAGVTNILPYIGPVIGAAPALLLAAIDARSGGLFGACAVYGVANLIDNIFIFPGIVAKLVKLNALVLLAVVVLGEYYYGITGMLISIPIAAAVKVVLTEIHIMVYGFSSDNA